MKKTIEIEGNEGRKYELELASNAATLLLYKAQFGQDMLQAMDKAQGYSDDGSDADAETYLQLLWTLAYSADKKIKPIDKWLEDFDIAPLEFIGQTAETVFSLLMANATTKAKKTKKA